jgi:hypothetical protein
VHPDRLVQPLFKTPFYIYTSDVLMQAMLWWLVIKRCGRQTIYNKESCPFGALNQTHWTVRVKKFTGMSDSKIPISSDKNFCPKISQVSTLLGYKCSDCGDIMWCVHVHQQAHQKLPFSWTRKQYFPWKVGIHPQDFTMQHARNSYLHSSGIVRSVKW